MYKGGMALPCRRRGNIGVDLFTIIKKLDDNGNIDSMRLLFDMRRLNRQFKRPPKMCMGSGQALGEVDLSSVGPEEEVYLAQGDLPNFFYTLSLEGLASKSGGSVVLLGREQSISDALQEIRNDLDRLTTKQRRRPMILNEIRVKGPILLARYIL